MPTTALFVPAQGSLDALAGHVKGLVDRNKSVLIVATRSASGAIFERFQDHGVDIRRVFIVDAVAQGVAAPQHDPEHVHFVPAPTLLELIAKRVERILLTKAQGPPHVIVYDCDTFALHNPTDTLIELVRYVVQQLAHPKLRIDFVIQEGSAMPARLLTFLREFLDGEQHLAPNPPGPPAPT